MTKKSYLGFSSILNFCILVFLIFSTMQIRTAIDTGDAIAGIGALAVAYPITSVFNVFGGAILFSFAAYLVKLIAERKERNRVTVIALLFDLVISAFFLLLAKDLIASGEIVSNYVMLGALGVCALTLLSDLFSFPAERWG